jgi:hypothetical protein
MSSDRDTTRVVRSWLEDGVTVLPDRVLDAVLDQLPATAQRRPLVPAWRFAPMNRSLQAVIGAAAVIAVAVVGLNLVGRAPFGAPAPTPSPTPGPRPSPAPSAFALAVAESPRILVPGTYSIADPFLAKVRLTVPNGWQGGIGSPYIAAVERAEPRSGGIYLEIDPVLYADPCHPDKGFVTPTTGPSIHDFVTELSRLSSVTETSATQTTIAGRPAESVVLSTSGSIAACADGILSLWRVPQGATAGLAPDLQLHLWVLTVGGRRLVIEVDEYTDEIPAARAEVQAVLESLAITP